MISIITLTYNHEKYIKKCIDSVLAQTYKNWEMIIIDDCSSDRTHKILASYARDNKKIRVVSHKKRWGIEKIQESYNEGLKLSKGELIAILEGDDFWDANKLEEQRRDFKKNIVLSYGDCITVSEEGIPFRIVYYQGKDNLNNIPLGSILYRFTNLNFYFEPITVMIKKEALIKIGGFQKDLNYPFVDLPTWLRLSLEGNFYYSRKILGYYRKQNKSSWFSFASKTEAMGREQVKRCFLHFIRNNSGKILSLNVKLNLKDIEKDQNTFIKKKKKNKMLSELLHFFIFGNYKSSKMALRHIADSRATYIYKIIATLIFVLFPLRSVVLRIMFYVFLVKYKLRF